MRNYEEIKKAIGHTVMAHETDLVVILVELVETMKSIDKKMPDYKKPGRYPRSSSPYDLSRRR
ncbi:MAG: hypothetical protein ACXABY_06145 [Candidatus Thorarchaeota archaeon]|jgi:hypothetical protein